MILSNVHDIKIEWKWKNDNSHGYNHFITLEYIVINNNFYLLNNASMKSLEDYKSRLYQLSLRISNWNNLILPHLQTKEELINNIEKILKLQAFI